MKRFDKLGGHERPAVGADVARLAQVSQQTVSRVLNGGQVKPETRDRVLTAMRQLNYRPNSVARALVTGRSNEIGVLGFDTKLYGPASTLFGIERAAHEADYVVTIVGVLSPGRASFLHAIERLRVRGVAGILAIAPQESTVRALAAVPPGVPLVAVEAGALEVIPSAAVDHFAGGAAATHHLLELGHRTVSHITGPLDWVESQQRMAGWRAALQSAARDIPVPLAGDWSPQSGYSLGCRLVADAGVTAVFVGNDQMALGVMRAVHEAGRRIPEDVSVVGFDDTPEAPYFIPPLTTVHQDFIALGHQGVAMLLDVIKGRERPRYEPITPPLLVRASTAPPPSVDGS